jgi:hypothetical protein
MTKYKGNDLEMWQLWKGRLWLVMNGGALRRPDFTSEIALLHQTWWPLHDRINSRIGYPIQACLIVGCLSMDPNFRFR